MHNQITKNTFSQDILILMSILSIIIDPALVLINVMHNYLYLLFLYYF